MKYTHISNVLATTKRTNGTLFALMIAGLATLLFSACPEPASDSSGSSGTGVDGTSTDPTKWTVTFNKTDESDIVVPAKEVKVEDRGTVKESDAPTPTNTKAVPVGKVGKISKYVVGWYTDEPALTTPFDFSTPITKDITLYAAWQVEPTTIDGAGGKSEIKADLFHDDTTLTRVKIPDGVVKIGNSAFEHSKLTEVIIPNSVTTLGYSVFEGNKLTKVTISDKLAIITGSTFKNNKLTEVIIPNSVTTLGYSVFEGNKLTKVTISDKLAIITGSTFKNNKLTEVVIPDSVTLIEANAFAYNLLTKVTWGAKIERIHQAAFAGNRLTELDIPSTVKQINTTAFYKNPLTTVTIRADDVKFVGNDAFSTDGTPTLTKVVMPKKLHTTLKGLDKLGDGIIFKFKDATPKYVDITDGKTEL